MHRKYMKTHREVIKCAMTKEEIWVMGRKDKANEKRQTSWQLSLWFSAALYPTQPGYECCPTL